jgi:hypothetical protein
MLCKKYDELGHFDKVTYIGELLHACQSDDLFFEQGEIIIRKAKVMGLFNGVVILPDHLTLPNESNQIENEQIK